MKHNSYFGGKVQSLALDEADGPATVGVIEPGAYEFSTSSEERMTVLSGLLRAKLPGEGWKDYAAGGSFVVPAKVSFQVEAVADAAYLCRYR
jgi:purine/pyrimidine-nucleoside phosphorylase